MHFDDNKYNAEQWVKMEAAGAVFLPAGGHGYDKDQYGNPIPFVWENDPEHGAYSSSTEKDEDEIYRIAFQEETLHDHTEGWKDGYYSVRMTRTITVLSENDEQETFATKYPNAKDKPHAFVERTLWKDGYFNTLCLPFAVKSIAASPLAGAEVFAFTGGEVSGTQGNEVLQLLLKDRLLQELQPQQLPRGRCFSLLQLLP